MDKVKLTVEHKGNTYEFEREMVFFIALDDDDKSIDADSGLIGNGSAIVLGEAIAKSLLKHPHSKKIIAAILLTLAMNKGIKE